jgi:Cof subfamily protein (haloacid dehalogenase superfamily)
VGYKLLALDLDGTVVQPDLSIDATVRAAIAAAQAQGVYVTIATGRMFGATLPFAHKLNISGPLICFQGGLIRDTRDGAVLHHAPVAPALAAEAIQEALRANLFVLGYIDERLWIAERRPELDLYLSWHPERPEVVLAPNLAEVIARGGSAQLLEAIGQTCTANPPTKLLFVAEPAVVERECARLAAHFAGRLAVVRSHALFGELTALGVNKGAALARLAAHLGIAREDVIAIGDHENDIPMLEWAGLGLAMGNAIPAAQAAADVVIPSVSDNGVAWAIARYILNPT